MCYGYVFKVRQRYGHFFFLPNNLICYTTWKTIAQCKFSILYIFMRAFYRFLWSVQSQLCNLLLRFSQSLSLSRRERIISHREIFFLAHRVEKSVREFSVPKKECSRNIMKECSRIWELENYFCSTFWINENWRRPADTSIYGLKGQQRIAQDNVLGRNAASNYALKGQKHSHYQRFCPFRAHSFYSLGDPGRCPGLIGFAPSGRKYQRSKRDIRMTHCESQKGVRR